MLASDTRICSNILVRLRDHLEAYGAGGTAAMGRCKVFPERRGAGE